MEYGTLGVENITDIGACTGIVTVDFIIHTCSIEAVIVQCIYDIIDLLGFDGYCGDTLLVFCYCRIVKPPLPLIYVTVVSLYSTEEVAPALFSVTVCVNVNILDDRGEAVKGPFSVQSNLI